MLELDISRDELHQILQRFNGMHPENDRWASRFFHLNVKTLSHDKTTIPPEPATCAGLSLVPLFLLGFTLGQPFTGLALFWQFSCTTSARHFVRIR
jgi:hypothetical protein